MFTKVSKKYTTIVDMSKLSEDGRDLDTPVSQSDCPDFLFNSYGFPLNEIAALERAQNVQEANLLLERIQNYVANNPDNSRLSLSDMIKSVSPRSAQCPSEVARAAEYISAHWQDKVDSAISAAQARRAAAQAEVQQSQQQQPVPDINV